MLTVSITGAFVFSTRELDLLVLTVSRNFRVEILASKQKRYYNVCVIFRTEPEKALSVVHFLRFRDEEPRPAFSFAYSDKFC